MTTSSTVSRPEKSLPIRTYVAFSPKARLYINAVLEDFVHMSSMLSILNRRMGAVAELRPLKSARIRRNGRVSHEGDEGGKTASQPDPYIVVIV
jgi:hypothetical protein